MLPSSRLPSRRVFLRRLGLIALLAALLVGASLGLGAAGYHWLAGLGWLDAFLNAAMILTGMGPVNPVTRPAGKIFAAFYALFSGVAFLTGVAMLLAPVVHRVLHRYHLDLEDDRPRR